MIDNMTKTPYKNLDKSHETCEVKISELMTNGVTRMTLETKTPTQWAVLDQYHEKKRFHFRYLFLAS